MLLELQNIKKQYDFPDNTTPVPILQNISLKVNKGESIAIVGPSGSGKSTLLNIIGALDAPTSGTVNLAGQDLSSLNDKELADIRNRDIGFVFQLHHLLPQCTVLENVLLPTLPQGKNINSEEAEERANHLLDVVGLTDRKHYKPAQLSGGERQRVAVVRALINKPKLLLADEPTGSLDLASAENLGSLLSELNKQEEVTLILVTHSMELANQMGRKFSLHDGRLVEIE
ncbi:ABC transporter ATP-binding protein [candidate division KSB1 bacterium]|nr:ABC transporter ATP-binding protein [candidate division KSB1 bacterium]MBL7094888.1 ABC transporter ATP-binding protein [candidate division KSB1 bacterium]